MRNEARVHRPAVLPTGEGHRVTTLELYFDLVFVFAFTQVTQLMADEPTGPGAVRGLVLMALLWWAWSSYAWLGNQARADEGLMRLTLIVVLAVMFVLALAIPESFADLPGGLDAPSVLAACYVTVRLVHLGVYLVAAGDDRGLRRQLFITAPSTCLAGALLVAGGAVGPPAQTAWWALALLVDYAGVWLAGVSGWRLPSPGHFAERHALILLIALGESLVAIGVGVAHQPVSVPVVVGALLGVVLVSSLWWLYFDVVAPVAEHRLAEQSGSARTRLARDSYTYLHFLFVASVLFVALGLKKVLAYVADTEHHDLADPLTGMPLLALLGGLAVHLLTHVAFRRRNTGTWNPHRTTAAVVLLLLVPVCWRIPALATLGVAAALLAALVGYEYARFHAARAGVRGTAGP